MRFVDLDRIAKNGNTVRQNREETRDPGFGWARKRLTHRHVPTVVEIAEDHEHAAASHRL
jgi:hypothetical protein